MGNLSKEEMMVLLDVMSGNSEGAIERSEARAQKDVVANQRLPIKGNPYNDINATFQYERMGIIVIDTYDDLFYNVILPEGWEIKATGHSMWNDVFDNNGRKRMTFFYKGAFYDRSAHVNFECRYSFRDVPEDNYESNISYEERQAGLWYGKVYDGNKVIFTTEGMAGTEVEYGNSQLKKQCLEYLNENFPEWEDINAYWDEED